jgi:hypothetical protein
MKATTARPITRNVDRTEMIQVKSVIVETWHPNGRVLSSHRSDQRGHMPGLATGARIGIVAVLGIQVDVWVAVNDVETRLKLPYRWTPGARALPQTSPAFLLAPAKLQEIIECAVARWLGLRVEKHRVGRRF